MKFFILSFLLLFFICYSSLATGVNLGNDTALCGASYYILDAGSGYKSYLWSTGDSSQMIAVTTSGTYGVKVKDYQKNQSSDHINIVFSDYPTVDLGNDTTYCSKNQVKLTAGSSIYTYNWSTGDTASKIMVSNSGMYAVQVTNQYGCSISDTINLLFSTQAEVTLGNDTVVCAGTPLTLDAGSGYTNYKWSTGDTVQSITVTQSDKYIVKVTDSVGCIIKDKINVVIDIIQPIDLVESSILCNQSFVNLTTNGFYKTYLWSNGDTSKNIQVSSPGIYNITVIDVFGCPSYDSTLVISDTLIGVNLGSDKILCQGDTITLDAGSGYIAYLWSTGDTTQQTVINTSGSYNVYVKKSNECIDVDKIEINYANAEPIKLGSNLFICLGDSIMLDAGSGYAEYHWSTQDTLQQTYADTAGSYFVVVVDTNGCLNSGLVEVFSYGIIPVNLGSDTCMNDPFRLHAGANYKTYLWSTAETDSVIIVKNPGIYYIEVVDSNGCASYDSIYVTYCFSHGINEIISTNALQFNNPIKDNLLITYDTHSISIEKIEIFNSIGQMQIAIKNDGYSPIQIDTHLLTPGMYWLIAFTNQGIVSKQIMKAQ